MPQPGITRRYQAICKRSFERHLELFLSIPAPTAALQQTQFQTLSSTGKAYTKRLRTRGTTLEIDGRIPELGYTEGNVVLCCYWCNDAKTDEFSAANFQLIADALAQVWRQRLALLE